MRIVNAMFGRGRGGLEQVFLDYGEALAFAGHEPIALVHPKAAVIEALETRQAPYAAIANRNAWDPLAMARLRTWLKERRPDAVVAHGNRAISLLKGAGARPLIGVAANYTLKGAGLDAVLCANEDLARYCRRRGFGPVDVIPHMVKAPASPPERHWHEPPVIGALGRFVAKKGFDVLIEAFHRLAEAGVPFRGVIAGDGEERPRLTALAERRGLAGTVVFPGWRDDTAGFYRSLDIFCLPSRHEPFGIVVLEAMAQALPVIATDSEGPSEILRHGTDGVIVAKGDAEALAAALAQLLLDRQAAQALGLNAHAAVRAKYSLELLSRRLDVVVRRLAV